METGFFSLGGPILVAGPCAAESEAMLWRVARALKAGGGISMFRCGSWKVRSKPDGFEGMGEEALPVLCSIRDELQLPVCVEVASPAHVEALLRHGIRCCWIGARTTVNPQQVSEIAEAARGSNLAVMVKNPVVPDLKLWEGAFDRLSRSGITDVAAVHRGFSTGDPAPYRNRPLWHLVIEWKCRHPELPLICDPSHIAGCRSLLAEVAQKALYLHCDGLMLEVHPFPDDALSDASQQLAPDAYYSLLSSLTFPSGSSSGSGLEPYRAVLDELDSELLALLSRRMEVSRQIALMKREKRLPLLQPDRWKTVLSEALRRSEQLRLPPDFVEEMMNLIHAASIGEQEKVCAGTGTEA